MCELSKFQDLNLSTHVLVWTCKFWKTSVLPRGRGGGGGREKALVFNFFFVRNTMYCMVISILWHVVHAGLLPIFHWKFNLLAFPWWTCSDVEQRRWPSTTYFNIRKHQQDIFCCDSAENGPLGIRKRLGWSKFTMGKTCFIVCADLVVHRVTSYLLAAWGLKHSYLNICSPVATIQPRNCWRVAQLLQIYFSSHSRTQNDLATYLMSFKLLLWANLMSFFQQIQIRVCKWPGRVCVRGRSSVLQGLQERYTIVLIPDVFVPLFSGFIAVFLFFFRASCMECVIQTPQKAQERRGSYCLNSSWASCELSLEFCSNAGAGYEDCKKHYCRSSKLHKLWWRGLGVMLLRRGFELL